MEQIGSQMKHRFIQRDQIWRKIPQYRSRCGLAVVTKLAMIDVFSDEIGRFVNLSFREEQGLRKKLQSWRLHGLIGLRDRGTGS